MTNAADLQPSPAVFRQQTLEDLKALLPADNATALIGKFEGYLRDALAELEASRAQPEAVASLSHKIAAVAGTLGLEELAELSRDVMVQARTATTSDGLSNVLRTFFAAAARAAEALKSARQCGPAQASPNS